MGKEGEGEEFSDNDESDTQGASARIEVQEESPDTMVQTHEKLYARSDLNLTRANSPLKLSRVPRSGPAAIFYPRSSLVFHLSVQGLHPWFLSLH